MRTTTLHDRLGGYERVIRAPGLGSENAPGSMAADSEDSMSEPLGVATSRFLQQG